VTLLAVELRYLAFLRAGGYATAQVSMQNLLSATDAVRTRVQVARLLLVDWCFWKGGKHALIGCVFFWLLGWLVRKCWKIART